MLGLPSMDALGKILRPLLAPILPPPDAESIYWSARASIAAGLSEDWGVQWRPGTDSTAAGVQTDSYRAVADSPDGSGNADIAARLAFPPGWRGIVRLDCMAAVTAAAGAQNPQLQCVWSIRKNGATVPGFARQHVGGDSWREVAAGNTNNGFGRVDSATPCPLQLLPGDRLSIRLENGTAVAVDFLVRCYGWRWNQA